MHLRSPLFSPSGGVSFPVCSSTGSNRDHFLEADFPVLIACLDYFRFADNSSARGSFWNSECEGDHASHFVFSSMRRVADV
jgi:hypothetical protein